MSGPQVVETFFEDGIVEDERVAEDGIVEGEIIREKIKNFIHKLSPGSLGVTRNARDICHCRHALFIACRTRT
jgi:hypothetical protein